MRVPLLNYIHIPRSSTFFSAYINTHGKLDWTEKTLFCDNAASLLDSKMESPYEMLGGAQRGGGGRTAPTYWQPCSLAPVINRYPSPQAFAAVEVNSSVFHVVTRRKVV